MLLPAASVVLDAPWNPYQGLPAVLQLALLALLLLAVLTVVVISSLLVQGLREHRAQRRSEGIGNERDYLWVYLVPALDEEVTIADSVQRIVDVDATHKVMLAIDDGSSDRTPEILTELQAQTPALHVLRRTLPNAQHGKSAALDDAWQHLHEQVLQQPAYAHWPAERIIVCIVDADGRIAPDSPAAIADSFADERVGGVQSRVRIYNRGHLLSWAQHVEFQIMASVFQLGRTRWGVANMGGNGQYMRLAALDALAVETGLPEGIERGPWRDRLTEDQDIGVRLMRAGWRGAQSIRATVDQQGVTSVRRLLRQRTRWAQGAWQVLPAMRGTSGIAASTIARIGHRIYLLAPALQSAMGFGLVLAIALFVTREIAWLGSSIGFVALFLVIALLPVYVSLLIVAPGGWLKPLVALVQLPAYLAYTWLIWPAFTVGLLREMLGMHGWAKTAREPLDAHAPGVATEVAVATASLAIVGAATATATIGTRSADRHERAAA